MASNVKGIGKGQEQVSKPESKTDAEHVRDSGRVGASDEFVKKASKSGVEFSKRLTSGIKFLSQAYLDEMQGTKQSEEEWQTQFKDVIGDILEKSGLNFEAIVEFAFKQYKKYLKENPEEREKLKKYVSKKHQELKDKEAKKNPH